jgi:hypothetical protein
VRPGGVLLLLLILGGGALVGLLLVLTSALRSGDSERPGVRDTAAESGLRVAEGAARSGGVALLRQAATPRGATAWPASAPGLAVRVEIAKPVPLGSVRALGAELSEREQIGIVAEVYRVRSSVAATGVELEAELVTPPALADAARLGPSPH